MRIFLDGNAAAQTFGQAHRHRPYAFRLGGLRVGRLISFGVNCAWTEFCLYGIAWKNMMEFGRGGACVPARVALRGRIHRSSPRTQCVYFWYGNAAARTFGRARRHRPYGFVWADYVLMVDAVWVDCAWVVDGVGWIMRGRLVSFGQITCGWLMPCGWITRGRLISFGWITCRRWHCPFAIRPVCLCAFSFFMLFISVAFIFSMDSDEGI